MSQPMLEGFRISPQQRRLWVLQEGRSAAFRAQCTILLEGPLDRQKLERVVRGVVQRHEALRTTFRGGSVLAVPLQVVDEGIEPWTGLESEGDLFREDRNRPADLEQGPLLRLRLLEIGPERHALFLGLPALCADGWTLRAIAAEIGRGHAVRDGAEGPEEEPLQYAEYCEWLNELLESADEEGREAAAFWTRMASGPNRGVLPGVSGEPRLEGFRPEAIDLALDLDLVARLDAAAFRIGVTADTVLLAVWGLLLGRWCREEDLGIGRTFDGRKYPDLEGCLGLFARSLPLRFRMPGNMPFTELVEQVGDAVREAGDRLEHAPWDLGIDRSAGTVPLPWLFESEEWPVAQACGGLTLSYREQQVTHEPFLLRLSCRRQGIALGASLSFDAASLPVAVAQRLLHGFEALLGDALDTPWRAIGDLSLLPAGNLRALLVDWNATATPLVSERPVHELFAEQAGLRPEEPALVGEELSLTYGELEVRANRLAHHLRDLGVGPEVRVAICLPRSLEVVVAMLAVLKSGGAYVPLDLSYPMERLALMLEDAGAPVVVTDAATAGTLPRTGAALVRIDADAQAVASRSLLDPEVPVEPGNLAYVLFTSGSTGRPKGVAIEHRQLLNYLTGILGRLNPSPGASYATVSTFAADLGNTAVFPSLVTGGCLHVIAQERATDPQALAEYFARHPIDLLKIVPSHLEALLVSSQPDQILPRRWLVIGGELAGPSLVERLRDAAAGRMVLNHYGPTETTVGAMTYRLDPELADLGSLPIGRPLANVQVFLLDARLQPVPVGVPGELHIGGTGLARGYLGRPDLTAERFLPAPFSAEPGARVYRTGDLARFRPDDEVEFLGRVDHQVKVRGFRIETGEIEAVLRRHPEVRDAVVMLREDHPGERRLVGYVVPRSGEALTTAGLRKLIAQHLPEPMIPAALCLLETLPLTPNGKVDRRALPAPERARHTSEASYVAPREPVEEVLTGIWSQVLGVDRVGVNDNFFELGGDSILVIQVVARASRAGLRLSPKQLFEHQTVAELAAVAEQGAGAQGSEDVVVGPVPLTPIERWFFELDPADLQHWNLAALYEVREAAEPAWFERVLNEILAHHDALRLRFARVDDGWRQWNSAPDAWTPFHQVDLSGLHLESQGAVITVAASQAQIGLSLAEGPLVRMVLFTLGTRRPARLLVLVHHLVADGVSWRVLLEDLGTAYDQVRRGESISFPPKTTSFKRWAERLTEYARSGALESEAAYWLEISGADGEVPVDFAVGENTTASERSVSAALDADETRALLQEVPAAYRTQINDVLLTALSRTLTRWTGSPRVLVDLEGHGREDLFEDVDLSRTIGWFTTHYPVLLEATPEQDPGEAIRSVKEQLRRTPSRGIGYGLLRYLSGEAGAGLRALPHPQIAFNYLGQFEQTTPDAAVFAPASESAGHPRSSRARRSHHLAIVGRVVEGRLQTAWRYSENRHRRDTVESLARAFTDELRTLIAHCQEQEEGGFTPSDFALAGLSQEQLERISRRVGPAKG